MFGFRKSKAVPPEPTTLVQFKGPTMGTHYSVSVGARPDQVDGLAEAVHMAISDVDRQMSTWKPDSDLSAFNGHGLQDWFAVPRDLAFVVAEGLKISRASQGAFDMTLGAAVNAWGFGPTSASATPPARPLADFSDLEASLDPPMLRKSAEFYS